jgi:hypothetical protein
MIEKEESGQETDPKPTKFSPDKDRPAFATLENRLLIHIPPHGTIVELVRNNQV